MTVPDYKVGDDVWGKAGHSKPQHFPEDDLPAGDRPINTFIDALNRTGCDWKADQYNPRKWKAQCPAHDDNNPSLDIDEASDGTLLLICRSARCPNERIVERLGLKLSDLFPSSTRKARNNGKPKPPKIDWMGEIKGLGLMGPAELLDGVVDYVRRYVVLTTTQASAVALWVLHTHAFDAAEASPYLAVLSPEKRCGKTLLLRVLSLLVRDPWRVISPSDSVVYRKIEQDRPTLLLDEADAIFNGKGDYEGLRAILNAGNEPDTHVPRCDGPNRDKLREFAVFCPKVLAGIGKLPETVDDRSIRISMKRKAPGEVVERFRRREAQERAEPMQKLLREWAVPYQAELEQARPDLPDELDDRAADGWEPLLAIADLAGEDWPARARKAALELSADGGDDSIGIRLLVDIKGVFDGDRLSTAELLERLNAMDEAPWGDWYGKPLSARVLARLLKPYEIRSRSVRIPPDNEKTCKGFQREQFEDIWRRYLPPESGTSGTTAHPASHGAAVVPDVPDVPDFSGGGA